MTARLQSQRCACALLLFAQLARASPDTPLAAVVLGEGSNATLVKLADLRELQRRVLKDDGIELVLSPGLSIVTPLSEVRAADWPAALRRLFVDYPTAEIREGGRLVKFFVLARQPQKAPPRVSPPPVSGLETESGDGGGSDSQMMEMMGIDPAEEQRRGDTDLEEAWLLEHMGVDDQKETNRPFGESPYPR